VREKIGGGSSLRTGLAIAAIPFLALAICACSPQHFVRPMKDGRALYDATCASCHGVDGRGDGPAAAALWPPPADLTHLSERYGRKFPRKFVLEVVTGEHDVVAHGSRAMPVWSQHFGPSEGATGATAAYARARLERLLDYIETLQVAVRSDE